MAPLKLRSEPPRLGFYSFTLSGSRGIYLYANRDVSAKTISAYVSFSISPPPAPRLAFETFQDDKTAIEKEFGGPLLWQEREPDKNYRVQVEPVPADPLDEADWPRQHKWLVDQIEKLYRIFEPRIRLVPPIDQMPSPAPST